jgi:hypothetical protein
MSSHHMMKAPVAVAAGVAKAEKVAAHKIAIR